MAKIKEIVKIPQGGTGAGTAAAARANLSAAVLGANSDITSLSGLSTPLSIPQGGTGQITALAAYKALQTVNAAAVSGTMNLSAATANVFTFTADQPITVNLTGSPTSGQELVLIITCDGSARTITWGTGCVVTAATFVLTASKKHTVVFRYDGATFVECSRSTMA